MKTLKLLSALFIAVLVSMTAVSCGDDDEEGNEIEVPAELKGQWKMNEDDFVRFKSIMLAVQEEEGGGDFGDVLNELTDAMDEVIFDFNKKNLYLIMHFDDAWLADIMNLDTKSAYIGMPWIEEGDDEEALLFEPKDKTSGKVYEIDLEDKDDKFLFLEYSNLTSKSVDIVLYTDDETYPTFETTLTKMNKKVSFINIFEIEPNEGYLGGDDDDDDDDW